ncbi:hypothetical protein [Ferrovibrio sp.]|uniref:hypothetical protein n=1 Tax=Ferrovibrio sp. TaxID=1917215 RepID=UPI0025BADAD9|nr:hypothetical protein [Ferrovibrio sp.]
MTIAARLADFLSVGVIQTSLDHEAAWIGKPRMEVIEEEHAITEIRRFTSALRQDGSSPDIVLLPELSVPRGFIPRLRSMSRAMEAIVIAGVDYREIIDEKGQKAVCNEAVIFVPNQWRKRRISSRTTMRVLGKTYPAPGELKNLTSIGYGFQKDTSIWLFDGDDVGTFAVAICYDFLDLERVAAYRGKIQHLFVLAYNKDINSFNHAAEALARMIFCNVIVCNCGYFGGSHAVSPYRDPPLRTVYQHSGAKLAAAQVVMLPVQSLYAHQREAPLSGVPLFKSLPPGFSESLS